MVTSKLFAVALEISPLKLSAFAFLIITSSPLFLPWELLVMVNVVPERVQLRPVLTVELETNQSSMSLPFVYA